MKRNLSLFIIVTLLLMGIPSITAAEGSLFTDLSTNHWSYPYVEYMVNEGIISGYPDGTFRPDVDFSRAAFAKLLVLSFDLPIYSGSDILFEDINTSHWAYGYIMGGIDFLTYYDEGAYYNYYPENAAEREDVAVAMVEAMGLDTAYADLSFLDGFGDSYLISQDLKPYVALAVEYGVMNGDGYNFNPRKALSRAEACTLFARFLTTIKGSYTTSRVEPGWYLTGEEFVNIEHDFYLYGEVVSYTMNGDALYDKYTCSGEEGEYQVAHSRRVGSNTTPSYGSISLVTFSGAPDFMAAKQKYTMTLSHSVTSPDTWGATQTNISFSSTEKIGYGNAGDISFVNDQADGYFFLESGAITTKAAIGEGREGDIRYIKVSLGNGYGYRYKYEWKE